MPISSDAHRGYVKVEKSGYVEVKDGAKGEASAKARRWEGHGSSMTMASGRKRVGQGRMQSKEEATRLYSTPLSECTVQACRGNAKRV